MSTESKTKNQMDQLVIYVSALILCTNAFKSDDILHPPPESNIDYKYAVDVDTLIDDQTRKCLRKSNITTVFVRAYKPDGDGSVDQNAITSIKNLAANNFGVEIYAVPQRLSPKNGGQQFKELYSFLFNNKINVQSVWLKVTSPRNWPADSISNIQFIGDFIETAQNYNVAVGIFTNWYDLDEILGDSAHLPVLTPLRLWYWNMNGFGLEDASSPIMNDFKPFNVFYQPSVKQYARTVQICSITANLNSYTTNSLIPKLSITNGHQNITVGFIGIQ